MKHDRCITPDWAVFRILEQVAAGLPVVREGGLPAYWLDPCAGDGSLIRAVDRWYATDWSDEPHNIRWHAVESRPECEAQLQAVANPVIVGDFLRVVPARYDVVITSPPHDRVDEFVQACLPLAPHVIMLTKLAWVEKQDVLLARYPADIIVCYDRPVKGHGKQPYAWFYWHKNAAGLLRHTHRKKAR